MNLGMNAGVTVPAAAELTSQLSWLTAAFSKVSDVALQNVAGLSAQVLAGRSYYIEFNLMLSTGAGGAQFNLGGGTASASFVKLSGVYSQGGTCSQISLSNLTTPAAAGGVPTQVALITGIVTCSSGGTLIPRFAQYASDVSASTMNIGAYFRCTLIN
jgi:hypothetical protein